MPVPRNYRVASTRRCCLDFCSTFANGSVETCCGAVNFIPTSLLTPRSSIVTVKYVGLGDGAFVVRDDDELTLFYEPVQHADKAVDVAFVHCRIHFVENAERTWSYHVNCEQQRHSNHGTLASA